MSHRRAVGAIALIIAVFALSACTSNPQDKAFGGGGGAAVRPSAPSLPSGYPSLRSPSGLIGGRSGGSSSSGSSSSGGSSSGSSSSGGSSGSSGSLGGSSPSPQSSYYNPSAFGEVQGENCRYTRSRSTLSYDVDIQNPDTARAFTFTFTVTFRVGLYPNSTVASKTVASPYRTVTVAPGGSRRLTLEASYSTSTRLVYSCQVSSARKYPSR